MKNLINPKDIFLFMIIAGVLLFIFSASSFAQDNTSKIPAKTKVVIKIDKNKNGLHTVIDTSFTLTDPMDSKAIEETMKKLEKDMKNMSDDLANIEVNVDIPDLPDSLEGDTLHNHMLFLGNQMRNSRYHIRHNPHAYEYRFEFPSPSEPPEPPSPPEELDFFDTPAPPPCDFRQFRSDRRGTISDIIGDIPMDRVKCYSIKERKNGKRIIIDIDDSPWIEKENRVIVIREPRSPRMHYRQGVVKPRIEKKIIIEKSDEDKEGKPKM